MQTAQMKFLREIIRKRWPEVDSMEQCYWSSESLWCHWNYIK